MFTGADLQLCGPLAVLGRQRRTCAIAKAPQRRCSAALIISGNHSVEMTVSHLRNSLYDSGVARFQASSAYCLKNFTTGTSLNGTMLKPFAPASLIEAPRR